jgi:hypothetical protein
VVFSSIISILIAEGFLRLYKPYSPLRAGSELPWMHKNADVTKAFTVDPDFGFRPILGNNYYNEYGTKNNAYSINKRPNVKRLLFIGDSVTSRERIINGLRRIYGDERFEFWNAGVESFNTVQEVNFYKKYNMKINPDHVILTFHLNDFETTPIAFYDGDRLHVYSPNMRLERINPWLFQHSYTYRLLLGITVSNKDNGRESIEQEVQESLEEIKHTLETKNIAFTVVVLPYLQPYEAWAPNEKQNRESIINTLRKLGIRYFDLFDTLNEAVKSGTNIQESDGDSWHPSEEVSILFSKYLYERQIF